MGLLVFLHFTLMNIEVKQRLLHGCLQFVIVVFPDHTHLLFSKQLHQYLINYKNNAMYNVA